MSAPSTAHPVPVYAGTGAEADSVMLTWPWSVGEHDGFVPDREVHRAGDEAPLVGFLMQQGRLLDHVRGGYGDPWPEHDLGEMAAAVGGLGHGAVRLIGVPGDHDARRRAGVQVGKHVALGERGREQLLGIPPARVAPEGRVGTTRDGLRPAGVPGPIPVPGPADRHLMITAVLPV